MFTKQLSVFIENREGRLEEVLEVLKNNNINIVSLSLADTNEYGLLRMLVSEPEAGRKALKERGFSAMLNDVLAVKISHKVGELQKLLVLLCGAGINVEYMYGLSTRQYDAFIVMKTSDPEKAAKTAADAGIETVGPDDLSSL